MNSRRVRDWGGVLREADAAISCGADACPQLFACKAEALLKLHRLDDADSVLSHAPKFDSTASPSCSQAKFLGMQSEAYILFTRAQIDMTLGRFESAATSIEKSVQIDPRNVEVVVLLQNIRSLCRARARGNDLFKSERFTEACSAYGEGLKFDPSNSIFTAIVQLVGLNSGNLKDLLMIVIKPFLFIQIIQKLFFVEPLHTPSLKGGLNQ